MPRKLYILVRYGYFDEFFARFPAERDDLTDEDLGELLLDGVASDKRCEIGSLLLKSGVDPAYVDAGYGYNALHIIFGANMHEFDCEPALVADLIAGGADINLIDGRKETPLLALAGAANFRFTDDQLAPFYDLLFAQDNLDLLKISAYNRSTYATICRWSRRKQLVERMNTYLTEHGIPIPQVDPT